MPQLAKLKTKQQKKKFLEILEKNRGLVYNTCKEFGISSKNYYKVYNADPEFKEKVDEIEERIYDKVECAFLDKLEHGDTQAQIYYLKTKMRHRGYADKQEIDVNGGIEFKLKIGGVDEEEN